MTATTENDAARIERWRAAFLAGPVEEAPGGCPDPDLLWRGARGELAPGKLRELLEHLAACRACADDWRMAVELLGGGGDAARGREIGEAPAAVARAAPAWRRWPGLAAAALAAGVLIVAGVLLRGFGPSDLRGEHQPVLRSLAPAAAALPRDASGGARLRWELAPAVPGARFSVWVTGEDLGLIAEGSDLAAPELTIPHQALAGLPPGARIYWRVEAALPSGERLRSPTFTARLESR